MLWFQLDIGGQYGTTTVPVWEYFGLVFSFSVNNCEKEIKMFLTAVFHFHWPTESGLQCWPALLDLRYVVLFCLKIPTWHVWLKIVKFDRRTNLLCFIAHTVFFLFISKCVNKLESLLEGKFVSAVNQKLKPGHYFHCNPCHTSVHWSHWHIRNSRVNSAIVFVWDWDIKWGFRQEDCKGI